ncbi:MAG: hypothetical protein CL772_06275 [Chloroflexi bacterium]|nr:hypothetical protein [Chloroflexota bacterium]|tara:strand:- start:26150 stop:26593 length:444 start_codon:yes stop_codon:yes gene_type:complete
MILIFTMTSCSDETAIYEPQISDSKIEFPFDERENGKFISIFRNESENTVPISIIMLSNQEIKKDSLTFDYCEGVNAYRQGKKIKEWTVINHNYPIKPENDVENQNDHPNLFSFNFPKGSYMIMLMNSENCNRDNYVIFDVKDNSGS